MSTFANKLKRFYNRRLILKFGSTVLRRRMTTGFSYDKYGEPVSGTVNNDKYVKILIDEIGFDDEWTHIGGLGEQKREFVSFFVSGDTDLRTEDKIQYGDHWYHVERYMPYTIDGIVVAKECKAYRDPATQSPRPFNNNILPYGGTEVTR